MFFVARENYEDRDADYQSDRLVSSIRSVYVESGKARTIVPADGARQVDLKLLPNGDLIFSSNRATDKDVLELWRVDPTGQLNQLSDDGVSKRHAIPLSASVADFAGQNHNQQHLELGG